MPSEFSHVFLPFRAVEGLGGMIFQYNFSDSNGIDVAITPEQFFLATLGVAFVRLFIGAYPDIQMCCFICPNIE